MPCPTPASGCAATAASAPARTRVLALALSGLTLGPVAAAADTPVAAEGAAAAVGEASAARPPLAAPAGMHTLCRFTDARWEHHATLWLPGTRVPWATATGSPGSGSVRVDAVLGERSAFAPVVVVALRGGGTEVAGETDPEGLFRLTKAADAGPGARLLADAGVRVVGGGSTGLRVGTTDTQVRAVDPRTGSTEVRCADVSIHARRGWRTQEQWWEAAGLPADAPRLYPRKGLALRQAPGGAVVAAVARGDAPWELRELGRDGGAVEVGWVSWDGTLWRGWVSARAVSAAAPGEGGLVGGLGALGAGASVPEARACGEAMPLVAVAGGQRADVGVLGAGLRFTVLGPGAAGAVRVGVLEGWLRPAEGAVWELPAAAGACPVVGWSTPSLDAVFGAGAGGL